jgi:hypothetical protein
MFKISFRSPFNSIKGGLREGKVPFRGFRGMQTEINNLSKLNLI